MECTELKPFHGPAKDRANALAHFLGGLVGEGHGEHLARIGVASEQDMGKTGRKYARLARTRASQHK
jgi:hypothetical protein